MTTPAANLLHERVSAALELLGTATARQLTRYLFGAGWTDAEDAQVQKAVVDLEWMGALQRRPNATPNMGDVYSLA